LKFEKNAFNLIISLRSNGVSIEILDYLLTIYKKSSEYYEIYACSMMILLEKNDYEMLELLLKHGFDINYILDYNNNEYNLFFYLLDIKSNVTQKDISFLINNGININAKLNFKIENDHLFNSSSLEYNITDLLIHKIVKENSNNHYDILKYVFGFSSIDKENILLLKNNIDNLNKLSYENLVLYDCNQLKIINLFILYCFYNEEEFHSSIFYKKLKRKADELDYTKILRSIEIFYQQNEKELKENEDKYIHIKLKYLLQIRDYENLKFHLDSKKDNISEIKLNSKPLLLFACQHCTNDVKMFDLLLSYNLDKNTLDDDKSSTLHILCKYNNYEVIPKLITDKNITMEDKNGNTPLMIAIQEKNSESIKTLLKEYINKYEKNDNVNILKENVDKKSNGIFKELSRKLKEKSNIDYPVIKEIINSAKINPVKINSSKKANGSKARSLNNSNESINSSGSNSKNNSSNNINGEINKNDNNKSKETSSNENSANNDEKENNSNENVGEEYELKDLSNYNEMYLACLNENEDIINILIECEYNINEQQCDDGSTPLLFSLKNKKYASAKILLKNNADIFIADKKGETTLSYILKNSSKNNNEILELLLPSIDLHQTYPPDNLTPLKYLIKYNSIDGIDILSKVDGFDINEIDSDGNSALSYVLKNDPNNSKLIEKILLYGANVNQLDKGNDDNSTLLLSSLKNENYEIVKVLIKNNADIFTPDKNGETPLSYVLKNSSTNNNEILELILPSIDIHQSYPPDNLTPLKYLIKYNNIDGIDILSKANGFDIDEVDSDGNTVFSNIIKNDPNNSQLIEKILLCGANVNQLDKGSDDDSTLLLSSLKNEKYESAKVLIKNNADIFIQNKNGETPLSYVLKNSSTNNNEILELILPSIDIHQSYPPENLTPLIYLIKSNNIDGIEILSKAEGFDINETDSNGNGVLSYVLKNDPNNLQLIEKILNYGANVNQLDKDNKVPLIYAIENENIDLVKLLTKYEADIQFKLPDSLTPIKLACIKNNTDIVKELFKAKKNNK